MHNFLNKIVGHALAGHIKLSSTSTIIEQQFAGQMEKQVQTGESLANIDMETRKQIRDNIRVINEKRK